MKDVLDTSAWDKGFQCYIKRGYYINDWAKEIKMLKCRTFKSRNGDSTVCRKFGTQCRLAVHAKHSKNKLFELRDFDA
jgi:hypothetical protein